MKDSVYHFNSINNTVMPRMKITFIALLYTGELAELSIGYTLQYSVYIVYTTSCSNPIGPCDTTMVQVNLKLNNVCFLFVTATYNYN